MVASAKGNSSVAAVSNAFAEQLSKGLAEARVSGQPVFIDFWASWCKNCSAMEHTTFSAAAVKARLAGYHEVRLQAERPNQAPAKQVLDHFNHNKNLVLSEMMADELVLAELKKVKGLLDAARSGLLEDEQPGTLIGACELLLEGLHAQKKLARNEERGGAKYSQAAPERPSKRRDFDDWSGGRLN